MIIILKYFLILIMLVPIITNSKFLGKSEKAAIRTAGVLSLYASECGDLTPFGERMFYLIITDQENKGRDILKLSEFDKGFNTFKDEIKTKGLLNACKDLKNSLENIPLWNRALE